MGCVSSRRDINDIHPNIFQVMNVNERRQDVSPGQLELTEAELVLYQRGKEATRWPLRCLRRYGFDAEIFSFESGRRCPTGPGIYAFRCGRAEKLFNLVQQNIQQRNLGHDELVSVANELSIPTVSSGPPVSARLTSEQSFMDTANRTVLPRAQNNRMSRPGSVTSNGPASPPSASSPTPLTSDSTANTAEHNNNKRTQHSYSNTAPLLDADCAAVAGSANQPYMNLEPTSSPTLSSSSEPYAQLNMDTEAECCHVYMNITPGESAALVQRNVFESPTMFDRDDENEDPRHCYANLNPGDMEPPRVPLQQPQQTHQHQQHREQSTIASSEFIRKVNYIVLDLKKSKPDAGGGNANPQPPPESPRCPAKGYATIDFNKTVALSHSVNPCLDLDNEGSRKTRHNSTIGELAPILARHSTSLSD